MSTHNQHLSALFADTCEHVKVRLIVAVPVFPFSPPGFGQAGLELPLHLGPLAQQSVACIDLHLVSPAMNRTYVTRGPLVLYHSPECIGYAELEQAWKYMTIIMLYKLSPMQKH